MSKRYFINLHALVPMRRNPQESSEMLSQLVFGEFGEIVNVNDSFVYVKNKMDSYEGWVDAKMIVPLSDVEYEELQNQPIYRVNVPMAEAINESDQSVLRLPGGSILPFFDQSAGSWGYRGFDRYKVNADLVNFSHPRTVPEIVSTAKKYLYAPYLWGGKNSFGIDCSGFVQVVFAINGYSLPRDASQQISQGAEVINLSSSQTGDLAFFEKKGKITHVGILLSSEEIIHASGQVKIEKIDDQGIISKVSGEYTHRLAAVKRIIQRNSEFI